MIGRYKLLEQIGEGGFGVVYMAEQVEPVHRRVALKIIKAGMDTKAVVARFEAERQAAALMDHPNIARVLDGGVTQAGRPYFVMELVRGLAITEFCDQRSLDTTERLKLFIQVCKAVQHAHQKGIIHRDLKPSNILVTLHDGEPVPKIIDFGVAKALGQRLTEKTLFTGFMHMVGTPAYMSPEQAELSGLDIDTRSDIYSLGVLLYELLTGTTPFDPDTVRNAAIDEVRRMIRETEPERPSNRLETLGEQLTDVAEHRQVEAPKLVHLVRGDLDWIVMMCLEKDRKRRYETANGLAMDVQRYLDNEPVVARPRSRLYELHKTVRRHKFGFAAAAALVFVLALGAVVSATQAVRALRAEQGAAEERDHALAAEAEAQKQRSLALLNLYRAHIRLATQDWESGQLRSMVETLQEHIPKAGEPDHRGWEWYYLWSVCHNTDGEFGQHDGPVSSLAMHPDGRWLASSSGSLIKVWDMGSGREVAELSGHTQEVTSVAWSPDGTKLASCGLDCNVILWEANRFHRVRTFNCRNYVFEVQWSPDGTQLATAQTVEAEPRNVDGVIIWDAASGKELHRLASAVGRIHTLGWQPQSTMLVAGGDHRGGMQVWDPKGGKPLKTFKAHYHALTSVRWSPDGRRLASASVDQRIRIWAADTWELLLDIEPAHDGHVTCLVWSEDGRTLISGGEDGLLKTWGSHNGNLLHVLRAHTDRVNAVCWSRDGEFLISGGGDPTIRRWRPDEDQLARVMAGGWVCAWSPDERYLAIGGGPNENDPAAVFVQDTATWQTLYRLPYPTNRTPRGVGSSGWSPDGRMLAVTFGDSFVQVWDMATQKEIWCWEGNTNDRSEDTLAVGSMSEQLVRIWEPETGKLLQTFKAHSGPVDGVVWHPHDRRIASRTMTGQLLIWDVDTGAVIMELHCPGGRAGMPNIVDWNPEGTLLAAGCGNGSIRIWDDRTGSLVQELKRHEGNVRSVNWSPDGRRLVSGAEDRTIRIWDMDAARELMSLPTRHVWLPHVFWSPSGRMIAVCSDQIRVYDARIGYELAPPAQ